MSAASLRAALPKWGRAAAAAMLLLLPGLATAQDSPGARPAPRPGTAARPNGGAAGTPGMAPLQTEPGDIWAEVRSWTKGTEAPAKPAAPARRKPAKPAANPG